MRNILGWEREEGWIQCMCGFEWLNGLLLNVYFWVVYKRVFLLFIYGFLAAMICATEERCAFDGVGYNLIVVFGFGGDGTVYRVDVTDGVFIFGLEVGWSDDTGFGVG